MPPRPEAPRYREPAMALAALAQAVEDFFEEGYAFQVNQREIDETPAHLRSAALTAMLPARTQAEGFYAWVRYLVWLDGIRELAPSLVLTAAEAEGLAVLRRQRNKFQREHPPCHHCGMPNAEGEYSCHACLKEIKH